MFFRSLTGRILILSLLLFSVAIGTVTLLHIRREHQHITSNSRETAELMLAVIERSIAIINEAPFLTAAQKRDILYDNAARFLRLSSDDMAGHRARGK
jgi:hypothetical protein